MCYADLGQAKLIRLAHLAGWESGQRIPNPTSRLTEPGVRRSMPKISLPHSFLLAMIPKPAARIPWRARHTLRLAHRDLFLFSSPKSSHLYARPRSLHNQKWVQFSCKSASLDSCHLWLPNLPINLFRLSTFQRRGAVRGLGVAFFRV